MAWAVRISCALFPLLCGHVILVWELRKICKGLQVDQLLVNQSLKMRGWSAWRLSAAGLGWL